MPRYGRTSRRRLLTAHPLHQELFNEVIKIYDCSIIWGYRGEAAQEDAYRKGYTTKHFPFSKHNISPSLAVDAVPWPIDWKDVERMRYFGGLVKGIAYMKNIPIRWGGDWDGDNDFKDQRLHDLPPFLIV